VQRASAYETKIHEMRRPVLCALALSLLVTLSAPCADATSTRHRHRHLRHSSHGAASQQELSTHDTEVAADDDEDADSDYDDEECMLMKKGSIAPTPGTYYPGSPDGVDIQEIPHRTGDIAPTLGMFCQAEDRHCYMLDEGAELPADGSFFPGSSDLQKIEVIKGAVAPQVGFFCTDTSDNVTAEEDVGTQSEKEKLEQKVRDAKEAVVTNLRKQVEINVEIKHLDDEAALHKEVDDSVEAVANETQSWAMASFLGDMWKEMRMFAKPFYKEHLEEQLSGLEAKGRLLQTQFNRSQAALSAWQPKIEVPK